MTAPKTACAVAHANIALVKYWGKADETLNLPAVPSLSLTLDRLRTITRVTFDPSAAADRISLDGAPLTERPRDRVVALLDRVRARAGLADRATVTSVNELPTAAGLASSASGFAALALAATAAAGLPVDATEVSALARASSASAARSLWGGFVTLDARAEHAVPLAAASHFPLVMVVTITERGPKAVSSTEGMQRTAATSPYYAAWVTDAPRLFADAVTAVRARDLDALGAAMQQSTLMMHASMLAARPSVLYWSPTTVAVLRRVEALRSAGTPAFFTMDAGPHVKVLTRPELGEAVARELAAVPGVERTMICGAGPDASLTTAGPADWETPR